MRTTADHAAIWISQQQEMESLGRPSIVRAQHLDHSLPGWRKAGLDERERRWQDAFAGFVAQVNDFGRHRHDPSATWMSDQQKALKQGKLHEGSLRALDEAVPVWSKDSNRRESGQRANECENTVTQAVSHRQGI